MICLQGIRPRDIVVRCNSGGDLVDVRRQGLVIFGLCQSLVLDQLGLDIFLPLCLAESLGLYNTRTAVLVGVRPSRRQDFLVSCLVVWPSKLHVRRSICVVVRLEVRRDGLLELEVGLADARRALGALFEGCGTTEEEGYDRIPGKQPDNR